MSGLRWTGKLLNGQLGCGRCGTLGWLPADSPRVRKIETKSEND